MPKWVGQDLPSKQPAKDQSELRAQQKGRRIASHIIDLNIVSHEASTHEQITRGLYAFTR
jgi:hypothetical protein